MKQRQPSVWIIEMKVPSGVENLVWAPTETCCLTRKAAKIYLDDWRKQNPNDKFRVAKYERA